MCTFCIYPFCSFANMYTCLSFRFQYDARSKELKWRWQSKDSWAAGNEGLRMVGRSLMRGAVSSCFLSAALRQLLACHQSILNFVLNVLVLDVFSYIDCSGIINTNYMNTNYMNTNYMNTNYMNTNYMNTNYINTNCTWIECASNCRFRACIIVRCINVFVFSTFHVLFPGMYLLLPCFVSFSVKV